MDKSWSRLWVAIPSVLFYTIFIGHRASVENDVYQRQEKSFGTTDQCERRGKGNENWCHYTFAVGDNWYRGVGLTTSNVTFGETVDVFYDSSNPSVNALKDFSEESRSDRQFLYVLLSVFAAAGVIVTLSLRAKASPKR